MIELCISFKFHNEYRIKEMYNKCKKRGKKALVHKTYHHLLPNACSIGKNIIIIVYDPFYMKSDTAKNCSPY